MGLRIVFRAAVAISASAFVLSACSSGPRGRFTTLPASGVASRFLGLSPPGRRATRPLLNNIRNALLVADRGTNGIEVFRIVNWTNRGRIADGIKDPRGTWVDKNGSLYVANVGSVSVTEYNSNGNLIFAYPADSPIAVTTDAVGNVYVGDLSGNITEYGQLSNVATATCTPGGEVRGVAIDKQRDVFISYYSSAVRGIIEYPRGLRASRCNGTLLPISLYYPNGMIVDPQGKLLVCDLTDGVVDVIAPPYTSITGTFGQPFSGPVTVTLDKSATQAYVVEAGMDVQVLTYPGGAVIAVLSVGGGLSGPFSAVNSRNYIP